MGWFDKLMGRDLPERLDARKIYFRLLEQSRDPSVFGAGKLPDSYDGRIGWLTLHMAAMLYALRDHGADGKLLSQALFDEMKDDFEVALREEGISDTGVKRRIKPMIGHFYDRVKAFSEAFESDSPQADLAAAIADLTETDAPTAFEAKQADYGLEMVKLFRATTLTDIVRARFKFPDGTA